jgi:WD40 repeat protein
MSRSSSIVPLLVGLLCVSSAAQQSTGTVIAPPAVAGLRLVSTRGFTEKPQAIAFSKDNRFVVTGSDDGYIIVWDAASGQEIRRFTALPASVMYVRFLHADAEIIAGSDDGLLRIWNARTGRVVVQVAAYVGNLAHDYSYGTPFGLSNDENLVFTADKNHVGHLWDSTSGAEVARFETRKEAIGHVAFSPDDKRILIAGLDGTGIYSVKGGAALPWKAVEDTGPVAFLSQAGEWAITSGADGIHRRAVADGAIVDTIPFESAWSLAVSQDGSRLLAGSFMSPNGLWDVNTKREVWTRKGDGRDTAGAFSSDGSTFAIAVADEHTESRDGRVEIYDVATQTKRRTLEGSATKILSVGFDSDGPYVLSSDTKGSAFLWTARTSRRAMQFTSHLAPVIQGARSSDGALVLLGSLDHSASLWSANAGEERFHFTGHSQYIASACFSADNKYAFTTGGPGYKWDVADGRRMAMYGGNALDDAVLILSPSPNGKYVATSQFGTIRIFDADSGKLQSARGAIMRAESQSNLGSFSSDGRAYSTNCSGPTTAPFEVDLGVVVLCRAQFPGVVLGLSPDGRSVLASEADGATIRDLGAPGRVRKFPDTESVDFGAVSADSRFLITGSWQDGAARLWNTETGKQLCTIMVLADGTWIVVDSEGRFDTNDLEGIRGLGWSTNDEPMSVFPLEIFMRDYYSPQLLTQILLDEPIPAIRDLNRLNRRQPVVTIEKIVPENGATSVSVEVSVHSTKGSSPAPSAPSEERFAASDLRLFRNGQIVGSAPEGGGALRATPGSAGTTIVFHDIALPRSKEGEAIVFSAYAFNDDHVKSATAIKEFRPMNASITAPRRAYVVTFGVNVFENAAWNLSFAADDARATRDGLLPRLKATKLFDAVSAMTLVSDSSARSDEAPATKTNLRETLSSLRKVTPNDLVIINISTHGVRDKNGTFYLIPSDTGTGAKRITAEFLRQKAISSDDLSSWLRGVDAGQIVLVLDSCYSGAVVGVEFKPGPLGSRGLGQMAYDKRMELLAATQADSVTFEAGNLHHGVLTYSLIVDGLTRGMADFQPLDGRITLSELLAYAAENTNVVKRDVKGKTLVIEEVVPSAPGGFARRRGNHQPVLFDFAKSDEFALTGWQRFDRDSVKPGEDPDEAELALAANSSNPLEASARIRLFIAEHPRHPLAPIAYLLLSAPLIEAKAPSLDLISAARLAAAYNAGSARGAALAARVLEQVAQELKRRQQFLNVATEFESESHDDRH